MRTVLLAVIDDALAFLLLVVSLSWAVSLGILTSLTALLIGIAGTVLLAFIAYKTAAALLLAPRVTTSMEGRRGTAVTEIGSDGMILVDGELWKARSREPIEKGTMVVVEKAEGLKLTVSVEKMDEGAR